MDILFLVDNNGFAKDFKAEAIVKFLLTQAWQHDCQIITDYVSPNNKNKKDFRCVIKHLPTDRYLRYSKGPHTGTFWDCYGDDFLYAELALLELSKAPCPLSYPVR